MSLNFLLELSDFADLDLGITDHIGEAPRPLLGFVKGSNLDLSQLDKNHIAVALETSGASFVKTRTFKQANAARRSIKVVEK